MTMIDGLAGLFIGATTTLAMVGVGAVDLEGSHVSIEAAVGVVVFTCGVVWWLSAKFRGLDDHVQETKDRLKEIEKVLRNCPAAKNADCELSE